jgi:hypothetical protein
MYHALMYEKSVFVKYLIRCCTYIPLVARILGCNFICIPSLIFPAIYVPTNLALQSNFKKVKIQRLMTQL